MTQITGHISQIIGPVIDVFFDTKGLEAEKVLPKIHEALKRYLISSETVIHLKYLEISAYFFQSLYQ